MNRIEQQLAEISRRHQDCTGDKTCAAADDDFIALLLILTEIEHRAPEHVPSTVYAALERMRESPFDPKTTHVAIRELVAMCAKLPPAALACKYLGQPKFLDHAFAALGRHFANREEFDMWYAAISSDEDKECFLRIASFYRFLVLEGR